MAGVYFQGRHPGVDSSAAGTILLAALLILPTFYPEKTGWMTSLIPLPVFYYYVILGKRAGSVFVRNAIILALGASLLWGLFPMLIFSLTLVPLGIVLAFGVFHKKSPVVTGFSGFLTLLFAWLLYWGGVALLHGTNPYSILLAELDNGLRSGLMIYEDTAELAPETLESIRRAVNLLREYIPKILPALLVSALLTTSWLNLGIGSWLLNKKDNALTPWPEYNSWQLPDSLVWLVVISGVFFLLLPQPLRNLGLNGLIICTTIYFFQGLAIAASFLNRWSVPRLIRVLIYALIFIQTYGIIVLSFLGLVDVWADFRKLNQTGDNPTGTV